MVFGTSPAKPHPRQTNEKKPRAEKVLLIENVTQCLGGAHMFRAFDR